MPIWFRRKTYGWGWYPSTWQGWVIIAVFCFLIAVNSVHISTLAKLGIWKWENVILTILLVVILIGICFLTGERPRWQWGNPKKDS